MDASADWPAGLDVAAIQAAAATLPSADVDADVAFFVSRLGFRVERIEPADNPRVAVLVGHGTRIRLVRANAGAAAQGAGRLWLASAGCADATERRAVSPGGTVIECVGARGLAVPPVPGAARVTVVEPTDAEASWQRGRAGMSYRDLIPGRFGGRVVASHIRIAAGGRVADYVHFHDVVFQLIFCRAGWVRVVYEGQGEPFVMRAGDCVLQPARIRHRVLECSDGLEVVELGCPAEHATFGDAAIELPDRADPQRVFARGQRFVRHRADAADLAWDAVAGGFDQCDLGLGTATDGLLEAHVLRATSEFAARGAVGAPRPTDVEFTFGFVLDGMIELELASEGTRRTCGPNVAIGVPGSIGFTVRPRSADARWLRVCW